MKLTLPLSWKDITLQQLIGLMQTEEPLEQLALVTNTTVTLLKKFPRKLVKAGLDHLGTIQETADFVERFELEGVKYGFIPDWDEFTAGEYIDLELLLEDSWTNAPRIMSILYRPITSEGATGYKIAPYTAKEPYEHFLKIPANIFSGMLVFFWTTKSELLNSTGARLVEAAQRLQAPLQTNGGGIQRCTSWLKKTLRKWIK